MSPAARSAVYLLRRAVAAPLLLLACGGDAFTSAPTAAGGVEGAAGPGGANATGGSSQAGGPAKGGSAGVGGAAGAGTGGAPSAAGGSAPGGFSGKGGSTSAGGGGATGGAGEGGTGTAGAGTAGNGTAGTGTAGSGTAGSGTAGNESAGSGGSIAKVTLKDACAATSGAIFDPTGGHCYIDITSTQGVNAWNEGGAATACGDQLAQAFPAFQPFKSHLLEVEAASEQTFVTTTAVTSSDRDVWIHLECKTPPCACGPTCGNHAWQWVDDNPPQYWDPSPDMMPWGVGGPAASGKCAALTPIGGPWIWSERGCDAYQYSGGPTGQTRYYQVVCEIE
jgi:hypothetical protein